MFIMMEVSTSFDTLSQTSSPNRMKARSSNRQRREEQLEGPAISGILSNT